MAIVNAILPDRGSIAMQGKATGAPRNRLADETSPYLAQHAANPVDWYPWGEAAIARARELDRPILLSIGYSACHWCHVMAHESFEDEATAAVMNRLFVNVKVDREERPDLDKVYQLAHQMLTQRGGGWPLTMFLAPDDLTPFFGGTYFPDTPRYGMPAFADLHRARRRLLPRRARGCRLAERRPARRIRGPRAAGCRRGSGDHSRDRSTRRARISRPPSTRASAASGPRPSSRMPLRSSCCCATADGAGAEPDLEARHMAVLTLRRMAEGGIFDQLGGGFCRYSVDPFWMIPHFEKMLYDNGPLLALCAQAAVATGDDGLRDAALATAGWALREMRAPDGGFFAALDADSEGHEGRFYVWQRDEVESLLTPDEYPVFARRYGLDREPNFEGAWHLHAFVTLEQAAEELAITIEDAEALLDSARGKLLAARATADPAGARRQDPDGVECAPDPRPRDRGTPARGAGARGCGAPAPWISCAPTPGATAGCSRAGKAALRASPLTSTITHFSSTP